MKPASGIGVLIATIVVAAVVGFGVPLAWVWIGAQVQGGSGATNLSFAVAMIIFFGIVLTYGFVLYIAGWVISWIEREPDPSKQKSTAREPWMRGMTDTRAVKPRGADKTSGVETVFVGTTLIVFAAFWIWFFVAAGSSLPTQ